MVIILCKQNQLKKEDIIGLECKYIHPFGVTCLKASTDDVKQPN